MRYLTFALPKGRLAAETMQKLEKIGITCNEMKKNSRKLVFVNEELKLKFFLAKATDVPTYVEYGAADIGVAGKDVLMEEKRPLYEVMDLGIGRCRVVVAGRRDAVEKIEKKRPVIVATKYPCIAEEYFRGINQKVEIIKLNGSVELGPIVGLADCIVDIVETGATLKANGLRVFSEICGVSARLVVNRVSMKIEHERISDIILRLRNEMAISAERDGAQNGN